jgi:hypothetical protein
VIVLCGRLYVKASKNWQDRPGKVHRDLRTTESDMNQRVCQ